MNHLNSLILEGESSGVKKLELPAGEAAVFTLSVKRVYKKADGSKHEETSDFEVYAYGMLASLVMNHKEHNLVRVVGRLKQERWKDGDGMMHAKIVVIAEHIEWRPGKAKKAEKEEAL